MAYRGCDLILSCHEAETDHQKWLQTRNAGIGGSDASVIVGMNPYKSPYQLWLEKTGQAEAPDLSDNQYVYWGTKNEANIADWFQEETGKKVKRLGTLQSREYPFILANVDRTVIGENAGLEIKTAGVSQYRKWKDDEIPDAYYCQCLHYMAVTGADYWYIAVLIGGNDARWKRIERNEEDIKALIEAEKAFWTQVVTKTPPEVDGSESTAKALAWQYKGKGDEITLNVAVNELIRDMLELKSNEEVIKTAIREKENALKALLGNHEVGVTNQYKVSWKTSTGRESVSLSAIKKDAPEVYEELKAKNLIKVRNEIRRFSVKEFEEAVEKENKK